MTLPFKKELEKYKDMDEEEILNNLSAEELRQLEHTLEELDPEVREMMRGVREGEMDEC